MFGKKNPYPFLNDDDIEPLFKVKPPYVAIQQGFLGVVLYRKSTDSVQCHECGEFVKHLPSHIWNAHNTKPSAYRIKFGLPLTVPLVARSISQAISVRSKAKNLGQYVAKHKFKKGNKLSKNNNNAKYARNCPAFQNKFATCPAQIQNRYLIVADIVGRDPSEYELMKHDPKLMYTIQQRYGSINKFKDKFGFDKYSFKKAETKKEDDSLRKKALKLRGSLYQNPLLNDNQISALKSMKCVKDDDLTEFQCKQIVDIYSMVNGSR